MEHDHPKDNSSHDELNSDIRSAPGHDLYTLWALSARLRVIVRHIGVLNQSLRTSGDFVDLLDASDATWRAAVALERVARVRSTVRD
jgi:hypothetical protein